METRRNHLRNLFRGSPPPKSKRRSRTPPRADTLPVDTRRKDQHEIKSSHLMCFAGTEFVIEPSGYWHDELRKFRLSPIEDAEGRPAYVGRGSGGGGSIVQHPDQR